MSIDAAVSRREFLGRSALTAAAAGIAVSASSRTARGSANAVAEPFVDTHAYVGQWPRRRLACTSAADVAIALQRVGVSQAWIGSLEGLLHKDVGAVNWRLAEACRLEGSGILVPLGVVNPRLPDWQEELRRCHEVHRMPGIRLHPNYHGYALDDAGFLKVLKLAAARQLVVQLVAGLSEELHQPFSQAPTRVDLLPLIDLAPTVEGLRLVVAHGFQSANDEALRRLAPMSNVWFDFAALVSTDSISQLLEVVPASRILYGSGFPLAPLEAMTKQLSDGGLDAGSRRSIERDNARGLFDWPA